MDQPNFGCLALSILKFRQGQENLVVFPWKVVSSVRVSVLIQVRPQGKVWLLKGQGLWFLSQKLI